MSIVSSEPHPSNSRPQDSAQPPESGTPRSTNERLPLIPSVNDIENEFNSALREEDENENLSTAISKRPFAVVAALFLFALLYVSSTFFGTIGTSQISEAVAKSAIAKHVHTRILSIQEEEVSFQTLANFDLEYNRLDSLVMRALLDFASPRVGTIGLGLGSVSLQVKIDEKMHHVGLLEVSNELPVSLISGIKQSAVINGSLTAIGTPGTLEYVASELLHGRSINLTVKGTASLIKYGVNYDVPFSVEQEVKAGDVSDLVSSLEVLRLILGVKKNKASVYHADRASIISFGGSAIDVNAHIRLRPNLSVSGEIPALDWAIEIPGCNQELEFIYNASSSSFQLGETMDLQVNSSIASLPKSLISPCKDGKSPVDVLVNNFLAGNSVLLGARSATQEEGILPSILRSGVFPIEIEGKPASERLVQSVDVDNVVFDQPVPGAPVTLSCRTEVHALIPDIIILKSQTLVYVTGLRGVIQLYDVNKRHFGQVVVAQYMDTVTLPQDDNEYTVQIFFDNQPIEITNARVFADVSRVLMTQGEVYIRYDSVLDLQTTTVIGDIDVRGVHVRGKTLFRK